MSFNSYRSLDGNFDQKLKRIDYKKIRKNISISMLGKGNSISNLPFQKNSKIFQLNIKKKIIINKKKKEVTVSGNITVVELHNELQKNNLYAPYFPSYPNVTIGGCVANCVHGINPKEGIISDFIKEIIICDSSKKLKTLSVKKNPKLFNLTIGAMGSTGIILYVKLKLLKLRSSYIAIKKKRFDSLLKGYKILERSKAIYNQNSFHINLNKKKKISGIIFSGNFTKNEIKKKLLKTVDVPKIRLGFLKNKYFLLIFHKLIVIFQKYLSARKIHINSAFYPSNQRVAYFALMPKKFIEFQNIVPTKNIKIYLEKLEKLIIIHEPKITLGHLKIFQGKKKFLRFNGTGLAITLHIIIDKNFKKFYLELLNLDNEYNCIVNLYKNSKVDCDIAQNSYKINFTIFKKSLIKLKSSNFTNYIFGKFQKNIQ